MLEEQTESYQQARLTEAECRILLATKLYQKEHRVGPKWGWLKQQSGLSWSEFRRTMLDLRMKRLILYKHGVMNSTVVPRRGVEAVLAQLRQPSGP